MPMSDAWETVFDILGGGPGRKLSNQSRSEKGLESQYQAGEQARQYMQQNLEDVRGMQQPLIQMGDENLQALQRGVDLGQFEGDESIFDDYRQYISPEYQQSPQFQYGQRDSLSMPGQFKYSEKQMYPFQTEAAPEFNPYVQREGWRDKQYEGLGTEQYQSQQPGYKARPIGETFETPSFRMNQQQPGFYKAPDAQAAEYYDPTREQYQQKEFRLEDDPVYQHRIKEGNEAIEASGAARGMQLSGATLKALQENASTIAAEEGQAAWERNRQEDQTGYQRFQDQQNRVQNAMQYRSEDEYRRYLDSIGIRGYEAEQAVGQWNQDRQFGAQQNKEDFLRETASKQLGRELNNDEFQRWLSTDGQQYAQWADQRDWGSGMYQYEKGFGRGRFESDRGFGQQSNLENFAAQQGAYNQNIQNQLAGYQTNLGQWNLNRGYATNENQRAIDNLLNAYNVNNANYTLDRDFAYGANRDYEADRFNQFQYNVGNSQLENAAQYGMLTDTYNRNLANRTGRYGQIGDLANVGIGARQGYMDVLGSYYGAMGDIGMQQANAYAAMQQNEAEGNTLFGNLGLGIGDI